MMLRCLTVALLLHLVSVSAIGWAQSSRQECELAGGSWGEHGTRTDHCLVQPQRAKTLASLFWIAIDLGLTFCALCWALVYRRSWGLAPFALYWILALGVGVLAYEFLRYPDNSLAFAFPFAAISLLGMPWTWAMFAIHPVATGLQSILPGNDWLLLWMGIVINQLLLGAIALIWPRRGSRKPTDE